MNLLNIRYTDYYDNILERYGGAKLSRGIWYHGTSEKYLTNILSNGLIIDPKEKAWDVDKYVSLHQKDRSSYGGIYVTKNLMTAISSAGHTSRKTNYTSRIIVIMELQERSLISDEDTLWLPAIKEYLALNLYVNLLYSSKKNTDQYKWMIKVKKEWIRDCLQRLSQQYEMHRNLKSRVVSILNDGFLQYVMRQVAYLKTEYGPSFKYKLKDALVGANYERFHNESESEIQDIIRKIPSEKEGEKMYRTMIDSLTRVIVPTTKYKDDWVPVNITARSMKPIRFSGKNKIIAIANNILTIRLSYISIKEAVSGIRCKLPNLYSLI